MLLQIVQLLHLMAQLMRHIQGCQKSVALQTVLDKPVWSCSARIVVYPASCQSSFLRKYSIVFVTLWTLEAGISTIMRSGKRTKIEWIVAVFLWRMKTHKLLKELYDALRFILKALTHFGTTQLCFNSPCQALDLFSVYYRSLVPSKDVCTDICCCRSCHRSRTCCRCRYCCYR